jgi:hypothetical protein
MKLLRSQAALLMLLGAALAAPAADLAKIERAVGKEPTYGGKPKYGLLAFGPEAKARVWLVRAGDLLYVDRNGNGDLTEAGECCKSSETRDWGGNGGVWRVFRVGVVNADSKTPYELYLEEKDGAVCITSMFESAGAVGLAQCAGHYRRGKLELAGRAQDAPIVHFNGPLTLDACDLQPSGKNREQSRLTIFVGTPGLGTDTFAMLRPAEKPLPAAELSIPHQQAGKAPVRVPVEFQAGCCGDAWFYGTARTPVAAGAGKVKIALSFPDYPHGKVAPATVELSPKNAR